MIDYLYRTLRLRKTKISGVMNPGLNWHDTDWLSSQIQEQSWLFQTSLLLKLQQSIVFLHLQFSRNHFLYSFPQILSLDSAGSLSLHLMAWFSLWCVLSAVTPHQTGVGPCKSLLHCDMNTTYLKNVVFTSSWVENMYSSLSQHKAAIKQNEKKI